MIFCGKWYVGYGLFLFVCGLAGYLSNPEAAITALVSGSVFGVLSAAWGGLMWIGHRWAWTAALLTTAMLAVVFVWRSSASWAATAAGEGKAFAASIITLMLIASVASIVVLLRFRRGP